MKRLFIYILLFVASTGAALAQSEVKADTLRTAGNASPEMNIPDGEPLLNVKEYDDGFLLDMNMLNLTPSTAAAPDFKIKLPDAARPDYTHLFRLNPNVVYSQGNYQPFGMNGSTVYGVSPFGLSGFWGGNSTLQMGSFTLKNGMKLNTYGEYDKDGRRVRNPSALPWQRNNFRGAFELKSANGAFGVRLEVKQGRETPF